MFTSEIKVFLRNGQQKQLLQVQMCRFQPWNLDKSANIKDKLRKTCFEHFIGLEILSLTVETLRTLTLGVNIGFLMPNCVIQTAGKVRILWTECFLEETYVFYMFFINRIMGLFRMISSGKLNKAFVRFVQHIILMIAVWTF